MNLSKEVRWATQIGIELTFVKKDVKDMGDRRWGVPKWNQEAACVLKGRLDTKGVRYFNCGTDPGCVEVSSRILRGWGSTKKWYEAVCAEADKLDLTTFHPKVMGGAGHIHMGGMKFPMAVSMLRDMAARPYVGWALLDPNDDINANSLASASSHSLFGCAFKKRFSSYDYLYRNTVLTWNGTYKTVEWRAFDAAADWEIQEQQVAIVQRYAALFKERDYYVHGYPSDQLERGRFLTEWRDKYKKNLDLSIRGFREFIEHDLCLPWADYEWFVERNLVPKLTKRWSNVL